MIPIDDYNRAVAAADRRSYLMLAVPLLWMAGAGALCPALAPAARSVAARWFDPITAAYVLVGVTALVLGLPSVFLALAISAVNRRRDDRDWRLTCPCCGKSMQGMRGLVVATRNCGHCGKRALLDPE